MKQIWSRVAKEDYPYWQTRDKLKRDRIHALLRDILENPYSGIGKPERLKGDLSGFWSRRIDKVNRLVYRIREGTLEILSCRGHYDD